MKDKVISCSMFFIAVVSATVLTECKKAPTSGQIGSVVDVACTMLIAFDGTPEEKAICASADDVLDIVSNIRTIREDAGPIATMKSSRNCKIVGDLCASDAELAASITLVKSKK